MNFRKGDSGVFLHGKYWYDFELPKDGIQSLHDIDDHGRAQRQGLRREVPRCRRLLALAYPSRIPAQFPAPPDNLSVLIRRSLRLSTALEFCEARLR